MSRSRKKTSIFSITTAPSDKADKVNANRRLRRLVKERLKDDEFIDEIVLPQLREISNVWDFAKDGKSFKNINTLEGYRTYMRK
tara:strand:- start:432 stop:683 length:252 start_codon:yes stop_codon:yes gene_type:complete